MGILMGIGIKLAAQKLLNSAFTRAGKDKPEQDLDSYRDLDQKFETKEAPKEPVDIPLTPKEQFKESIGDRGYGLNEDAKSLYDRLSEDMKVVIDSNYEIANNLNRKLDYTNELAKTANLNALNAAQVAATYGKMNQEALIGLSQNSGSKIGGLVKSIWEGIKKVVGGAFGILAAGAIGITGSIKDGIAESGATTTGESGHHPGIDETIAEADTFQEELQREVERLMAEAKRAKQIVKDIENSKVWDDYSAAMIPMYNTYVNSDLYDPNATGLEGFVLMMKANNAEESAYNLDLADTEKAEFFDTAAAYHQAVNTAGTSTRDAKAGEKAIKDSEKAEEAALYARGLTTLDAKGITDRIFKILKLESDSYKLINAPSYELVSKLGYSSRLPENSSWEDIRNLGNELKREATSEKSSLVEEVRDGKILSSDLMNEFSLLDKNRELKNKYKKDDDKLFDQLVNVIENNLEKISGERNVSIDDLIATDFDFERERSSLLQGIAGGDIIVKKNGEIVDPSKITMLDEFNSSFLGGGYGSKLGDEYTFENAYTGKEISREGFTDWDFISELASSERDIQNVREALEQSGYSLDTIGDLSTEQFDKLSEAIGLDNKIILQMLSQIYLNTINNKNITVIDASGSGNLGPGD